MIFTTRRASDHLAPGRHVRISAFAAEWLQTTSAPGASKYEVVDTGSNPRLRVLIVDDEKAVADTLALVFSAKGYDTLVAYSAEQAADIVSQWKPRLIILDVVLPGMNGIEFAIQIKTSCPECRVLLFSGDQNSATLVQGALAKGHEFTILAKPVHPSFFLEEASRLASAEPRLCA